jgi:hypothetical protein
MAVGYEFKKHHTITMKNNINHKERKIFAKGAKKLCFAPLLIDLCD